MEIHQVRYFVAVAELGSFTRAAERCNVAQPSLSQQVRKLERSVGHRLFDRVPKGALLTEAGKALLPRARRILSEVRDAVESLRQDIDSGRGPLAVGAIPTMAPYLLPAVLRYFLRRFPECELTLREDFTERLVEAVADAELDCAVVSTPIASQLVEVEVIASEPLMLVAPRGHRMLAETPPTLADLRGEPAVVVDEIHCLGKQVQEFCTSRRMSPHIVCRSAQLTTVQDLVGLGLGISIVPAMCARADRSTKRQYQYLVDEDLRRDIAVIWQRGRSRSALARAFVGELRELLSRSAAAHCSTPGEPSERRASGHERR